MNCANHPEVTNVAYCRSCGKPLCANCARDVRGVIYCENCLAERLEGAGAQAPAAAQFAPPTAAGFTPPTPSGLTPLPVGPTGQGAPNPTVAGILAGFFPVGVGAVYTGQYAKGLAHLGIFVLLVMGFGENRPWYINAALGIALGFFVIYQIIDAVRSAKAIQLGQPAPDPFGLSQTFSPGARADTSKVPTAAVVLISLGVLFLLQTSGIFEFGMERVWPVLLIALGVWLFAKRQGMIGTGHDRYGRSSKMRGLTGPAVLITVGALSLIENLDGPHWDHTWPVLLLVIGLAKLLEGYTPPGSAPPAPGVAGTAGGNSEPVQPPPSSEVKHG
jgi:hypothetical protein